MRRRALTAAVAATAAVAVPAVPATAETLHVGMPSRVFTPSHLLAVPGDEVAWHNTSSEAHDVAGERVGPGETVARRFDDVGLTSYICVLHPSMAGRVEVVPALLAGPAATPTAGDPLVLTGRAPAGTPVTIEREGAPVADVAPAPDGTFRFETIAERPAQFRAVTPLGAGPPVDVAVADRVVLGLSARHGRLHTTLSVTTLPARPGATVLLQTWSRERFAWQRAKKATLDGRGRTTLTLERRVRRRARAILLSPDGRHVAISPQAFTWPRKRLPDPPTPAAPAPHHH